MAGNIKGITIEFRGETTKLDKALKQVNRETKSVDNELKQVNRALKFNPKNVELWKQKQQLLTKKVEETKQKLDLLKKAQAQMDADGVDKNSEEYRALQRDIIETESKLKHFEGELKKVGNANLKALSNQLKDIGDRMKNVGRNMTTHVTAPIMAVGAASVAAFNEVKDGLNIVAQKTGATGDELKKMQDTARELAKSLPTSFEDAGTAVGELNTRFGVTGQELSKLSEDYIKFAKVNSVDLNSSIDETQKALAAFGLSAADAPALLDSLTKAGQMTGASVDTLTAGLIQNGTAFQELGLNIDQAVMLMGQMETSGANSETVMQGLRKALKNAAADGVPLDEALSNLQDTIVNGTGSMDGLTAAYDLFGKSGDQIYGAVKNGSLDFTELAAAATDAGGSLDAVFAETLTPAEEWQMTMNSVKDAGYQIGGSLLTMLAPAMEKLASVMQKVSDWWNKLSPGAQKAIMIVVGIIAAIGPLLMIVGSLAGALGSIISLVGVIGPIMAGLAGPIGIVIAIIAGLVAAGVLLYKNWDKIKAAAKTFLATIKATFKQIKDAIIQPFETAKAKVKEIIDKIKSFFNFSVKKPHVPLPHFSISPKGWKVSDLLKGKIPSLGVKWYAKAMDDPYMFGSPTLFGAGEAGDEILYGRQALMRDIAKASGGGINYDALAAAVVGALASVNGNIQLFVDGKQMAQAQAPYMNIAINQIQARQNRQMGIV